MRPELADLVMERDEIADLDPARRRLALRRIVSEAFSVDDPGELVAEAADHIDGYGPLAHLMRDDEVTDVLVNGPLDIWVERSGRLEPAGVAFESEAELRAWIGRLIRPAGRRLDASHPVGDVRLADGSRMHVVLPPLAPEGPLVSVRRFPVERLTMDDLVERRTMSRAQADSLRDHVRDRRTIAVTGRTGTGKTTLVNALLSHVDPAERIVLVEETPELRPRCKHVVSLVARPPNLEGEGGVGLDVLLRAALRMRPDRIVVGEVRGPEALVALDAMSTGHEGSLVTVHARSEADAVDRMVALALRAGEASESSLTERFTKAFDLVVHLDRKDGRRFVSGFTEVS